jgi:membrane protein YqaA with SNARE-associated domain
MKWFEHVLRLILSFGLPGLVALSALDSTVLFFMPFAIDFLFIAHISRNHSLLPYYLIATAGGSILGCLITYWVVSKTSEKTLEKRLPKDQFQKFKKKLDHHGFLTILLAGLLPPPFPFSPFVLVASIAKLPLKKLLGAVFTGRLLRFGIEGILAIIFGRHILKFLNSTALRITMLALFALAIVGSSVSIYKWTRRV